MSDEALIDLIAGIWVANGGDADGLDWCYSKLKLKVIEKMGDKLKELPKEVGK